jgi:hypothetical protein
MKKVVKNSGSVSEEKENKAKVKIILGEPTETSGDEVYVEIGLTINIGNYESVRIAGGLRHKVGEPLNEKQISKAFSEVFSKVEDEVMAKAEEILKVISKRRNADK